MYSGDLGYSGAKLEGFLILGMHSSSYGYVPGFILGYVSEYAHSYKFPYVDISIAPTAGDACGIHHAHMPVHGSNDTTGILDCGTHTSKATMLLCTACDTCLFH